VLSAESTRKRAFAREDEWVLGILGSHLGVAIRNLQQTRVRIRKMELLHQIGLKIASKIEIDEILRTVIELVRDSLGYEYSSIFLVADGRLVLRAHSIPGEADLRREIPFGEGIVGRCAQRRKIVNIADVASCDFTIASSLRGVRSAIAVPILFEDRLLGVLGTESRARGAYARDDERLLGILCAQTGVAIRNAEMLSVLKEMIPTDEHVTRRM
jgi:sigma-B regulation protein RsbU (phosphoserine phosphatase)